MNTPVLSKKQQQKKLSAKKGLRNVLAQPYRKYWPVLDKDDESCLEELLNRLLPELKRKTKSSNWRCGQNKPKKQRCAVPENAEMETETDSAVNDLRKAVTMGVNAVTRDLEKDKLSSVLLDSTVESLMIKHVVVMAQNKGIPILLVPFLKNTTLENIGFACAAMGIKNGSAKADQPFHKIHQEIAKCSPPIPSAQKVLVNESATVTAPDSPKDGEMSKDNNTPEDDKMSEDNENSPPAQPFTLLTDVYKYRLTRKERIFVPPGTVEKDANDKEWGDFIAVEKNDIEMDVRKDLFPRKKQRYMDVHAEDQKTSPQGLRTGEQEESPYQGKNKTTTYLPLKVKRVQGNINRLKAGKQKKTSLNKS